MVSITERRIEGYPKEWDSLDLRDYLIQYGLVLRVRSFEKGFSFVCFHTLKVNPNIIDRPIIEDPIRLTLKHPIKPENKDFSVIIPNLIYNKLEIGIP